MHVADAEVEVPERRRIGVDAVPERPRPRLDGRAVGVVLGPVVVVVHGEADRDAAAEAGELGLVEEPPEAVGEVVGRGGVAGVAGVVGVADVALVDERRGSRGSRLEQAVVARVLGRAGELGAARREQHERPVAGVGFDAVRLGMRDGAGRGRAQRRPPVHRPARGEPQRLGMRVRRLGEVRRRAHMRAPEARLVAPFDRGQRRKRAPHPRDRAPFVAGIPLGNAGQRHHRHRRRGGEGVVASERVLRQPQPAGPKRGGVDEQDAAAPGPGGHSGGQLGSRLGVARAPDGGVQPRALRTDAEVQVHVCGRAGDGHRGEHAAALPAVLADDESPVLDRHAQVVERCRPAQQQARPQGGVGDLKRRELLAVRAVAIGQEDRHRLVRGRAAQSARHREHGGAAGHRHALVVQRRPLAAPAPGRRAGREVAAVPVAGGMQGRTRSAAALRELPRGHRSGCGRGYGPADRLGAGQPARRPAHRSGVRVQVYPGASAGRTPPVPAPGPV